MIACDGIFVWDMMQNYNNMQLGQENHVYRQNWISASEFSGFNKHMSQVLGHFIIFLVAQISCSNSWKWNPTLIGMPCARGWID